jgi:hypothetical protein
MLGIYHYIALGLFAGFALLDLAIRARAFPDVPSWKLKGSAFMLLYFAVATFAPLMWDGLLGRYQLVDGSALPFWAQVVVGFLVLQFLVYAWHRTMHNVQPLWRLSASELSHTESEKRFETIAARPALTLSRTAVPGPSPASTLSAKPVARSHSPACSPVAQRSSLARTSPGQARLLSGQAR